MKSFTGKFTSARGWVLMIALLFGAGLMISACGDEEVPAPTTPEPPPPPPPAPEPEPEPEPEPPATPTGLMVSGATETSITWTWNAVEGATGYVVQANTDEMWDDTDTVIFMVGGAMVPFTTETTYTASDLEAGTTMYVRVAAAAGTVDAPLVSAFSTHVTGMAVAPPPDLPPAPADLRLKERGSDFIEWEWDEVAGADGYQSEFSTDGSSFGSRESHAGMSNTTRRVSNLESDAAGHLRVRSYTGSGTGADTVLGEWSASNRQETGEPPPPEPLDAPENVETSDIEDDSVTLTWDEVDDADTYEVEQRELGDDWVDASCGGGNNEVEDEECVASDLDSGTDYDFRIRAVPADDDDTHTVSAWSDIEETRTSGTAAPEPTDPTTGGMGMANVRWHNSGTNNAAITFVWDREADAMYETAVLALEGTEGDNLKVVDNVHVENPCADVADRESADAPRYVSRGAATSQELRTGAPGTVMGLCVREEGSSEASFAWGISPAEEPNNGDPEVDKLRTVALEWTDVDLKAAFDYEVRLASDPERPAGDNKIGASSGATSRAVQSACDAGAMVDSFTPDIDLDSRTVTVESGLTPHTGYLLCIRASNTAGTGTWAVPDTADVAGTDDATFAADGFADEIFTLPAQAPTIAFTGSESTPAADSDNEKLAPAWKIDTRNANNVPRNAEDFVVTAFVQKEDAPSAAALRVADCGTTTSDDYTAIADGALVKRDGLSGFEIEVPSDNAVERVGFTRRVYLCAQADSTDDDKVGAGKGPWRISSVFSVSKPSTSLSTDSDSVTATAATIEIKGWNRAWFYKTNVDGASCQSVGADTATADLTGLTASTSYRVTAYDTCSGDDVGVSLGSTSFRTAAQ